MPTLSLKRKEEESRNHNPSWERALVTACLIGIAGCGDNTGTVTETANTTNTSNVSGNTSSYETTENSNNTSETAHGSASENESGIDTTGGNQDQGHPCDWYIDGIFSIETNLASFMGWDDGFECCPFYQPFTRRSPTENDREVIIPFVAGPNPIPLENAPWLVPTDISVEIRWGHKFDQTDILKASFNGISIGDLPLNDLENLPTNQCPESTEDGYMSISVPVELLNISEPNLLKIEANGVEPCRESLTVFAPTEFDLRGARMNIAYECSENWEKE